ncbi:O-methyltransferase-domain-containing protein [Armillaria luteobubalina]|uniref:O-methyltransferase-domain-containing protein n=1 Tax=Armillaria luteobubalina TaxID=153913 RepID=A0AA39Q0J1_9AGAR|nr:O-methyltransferase-domain-containing protein [Armillaria luteobubalina]
MAETVTVLNSSLPPTTIADWERSDNYHNSHLLQKDQTLDFTLQNSDANGLPAIAVSPAQGKLLNLLAKSIGAKRILEVGTLGGYSAIHLARALPNNGKLIATENITKAGVASKVNIIVGPALTSLQKMASEPKFDFVFMDADKANLSNYLMEAKRLVRKGGVIIVDNVVQNGRVGNPADTSEFSAGVRKLLSALKDDDEVEATTIGTAGEKGYDGFLYAVRK